MQKYTQEQKIAFVNSVENNSVDYAMRLKRTKEEIDFIRILAKIAREEIPFDPTILSKLQSNLYYGAGNFLQRLIGVNVVPGTTISSLHLWTEKDPLIRGLINPEFAWHANRSLYFKVHHVQICKTSQ